MNKLLLKLRLKMDLHLIDQALHTRTRPVFAEEVLSLYVRFTHYGLVTPRFPSQGMMMHDGLNSFHIHVLEELSRLIRYGIFDLERWNRDVVEREYSHWLCMPNEGYYSMSALHELPNVEAEYCRIQDIDASLLDKDGRRAYETVALKKAAD